MQEVSDIINAISKDLELGNIKIGPPMSCKSIIFESMKKDEFMMLDIIS